MGVIGEAGRKRDGGDRRIRSGELTAGPGDAPPPDELAHRVPESFTEQSSEVHGMDAGDLRDRRQSWRRREVLAEVFCAEREPARRGGRVPPMIAPQGCAQ